jgi:hypothetical protein
LTETKNLVRCCLGCVAEKYKPAGRDNDTNEYDDDDPVSEAGAEHLLSVSGSISDVARYNKYLSSEPLNTTTGWQAGVLARMRVPKLVKNGFNSVLPVSPVFEETKIPKEIKNRHGAQSCP